MIRRHFLKAVGAAIAAWFGVGKIAKASEDKKIIALSRATEELLGEGTDLREWVADGTNDAFEPAEDEGVDYIRDSPQEELRQHLIDAFTEAVDEMLAMPHHRCMMQRESVPGEPVEKDGKRYATNKLSWPYRFVLEASEEPLPDDSPEERTRKATEEALAVLRRIVQDKSNDCRLRLNAGKVMAQLSSPEATS